MEGILYHSTIFGRFAVNHPLGLDLTAGQVLSISLGGAWIEGRIEHGDGVWDDAATSEPDGYYFVAEDGSICGLCAGMRVRLPDTV